MRCPFCKELNQDKVIDSRLSEAGEVIRRRRMCLACNKRFTTKERAEADIRLMVIKRDGSRVPYDRTKILTGIQRACYKRQIDEATLEKASYEIEDVIFKNADREVQSQFIGKVVGDRLRNLDPIAYVRFMSVYRQFRNLDELIGEAQEVKEFDATKAPGQQSLFE